jgi:hypothetical protein
VLAEISSVASRVPAAASLGSTIERECTPRILAGAAARADGAPVDYAPGNFGPPSGGPRNLRMPRETDKNSALRATDPEIHELIRLETKRQDEFIRLIPPRTTRPSP